MDSIKILVAITHTLLKMVVQLNLSLKTVEIYVLDHWTMST